MHCRALCADDEIWRYFGLWIVAPEIEPGAPILELSTIN